MYQETKRSMKYTKTQALVNGLVSPPVVNPVGIVTTQRVIASVNVVTRNQAKVNQSACHQRRHAN